MNSPTITAFVFIPKGAETSEIFKKCKANYFKSVK